MNFKELFILRGELSKAQSWVLGLIGLIIFILVWWLFAEYFSIDRPIADLYDGPRPSSLDERNHALLDSIDLADSLALANATEFEKAYPLLPTPPQVLKSYKPLLTEDKLVFHTLNSIWLNIKGYLWAILISIPLGFVIGLFPLFKGLFSKQVDALRYLPLTALTGLFIVWFGIEDRMKVAFLAFGIIVYLLPVVAQRVREVQDVYTKTVFTLGATNWQTIKTVYIPAVMSKVMDDIRVLTAISWTYIIIAELLNKTNGVGALIYQKARGGQVEKVFAILFVIILIGFIQDRLFVYIDKRLMPFKTANTVSAGIKESQYGIYTILAFLFMTVLIGSVVNLSVIKWWMILPIVIVSAILIILYGELKIFNAKRALNA
jgi:ABC-type nitrate/sulfonate/bicarbonate transport system permease component